MHMTPKRIGFLIYPAMQALDLVGPMDAFAAVTLADGKGRRRPGYEVLTIGFDSTAVQAESGLLLTPQFTTANGAETGYLGNPGRMRDARSKDRRQSRRLD
jgi:transcriptional regulator GlxA family with amidase domain